MAKFRPYHEYQKISAEASLESSEAFLSKVSARRTVREFSSRSIPEGVLENCLLAAGTAPSGAHKQPWHFCVVTDPALKSKIRQAAEAEERAFYQERAPQDWLEALKPFATDEHKPFLEEAPALIAIFAENHQLGKDGEKSKNYYVNESVGIATGLLITALHWSGLACLTHTPSPMGFLREILERPAHQRAFLLLVVGYPAENVEVPDLSRKGLSEIATFTSKESVEGS